MTHECGSGETGEELIRAMTDAFRSMGYGGTRTDLLREQKDLIVQFRVARNGLGNYGRHNEPADRALQPSPEVIGYPDEYFLRFAGTLPDRTAWLILHYHDPDDPDHPDPVYRYPVDDLEDRILPIEHRDVRLVEFADPQGDILAIAVPIDHVMDFRPPNAPVKSARLSAEGE
ncbi:hypothetical protein [Nocardia sp. BMG111209]|uniref:hypothetical protein n=1 Tax=Nocardia sp. BMG111209 TaxID=1160137 RepID=UPI00035CCE35|nr:hypothetical protein [Nocardia sp. BMG111209]